MKSARVAALALAFVACASVASMAASDRDALIARWTSANEKRISAIKDAKDRAAERKRFDAERERLLTPPATFAQGPSTDLETLATHELNTADRYQLSEKTLPPPPPPPWWAAPWKWVQDRWNELMRAIFGRASIGPQGARTTGDILIIAVVLLLAFLLYRILAGLQLDRRKAHQSLEALSAPARAHDLYLRATGAAQSGHYAAASVYLFAATLTALDSHGTVAVTKSETVGDVRRQLRASDAKLVPAFDAVASPFTATAYAQRDVEAHQWERARDAYLTMVPQQAPQ